MFAIYHNDGTLLTNAHRLTHYDNLMGESSVTIDIKSPVVIPFAIGDYVDYRGHRYYMAVTPSVKKRARAGSVGGAFEYESVKFVSAAGYDFTRIKFRDVVPDALASTYHTNFAATSFAIYCESLITFGERLKANLDRVCTGNDAWTVKVRLISGYDYTCDSDTPIDHSVVVGNKGVALTISNEFLWDSLKHVPDDFGVNFFVQDRTITLGANAGVVPYYFQYGKGNGVFSFKRSTDDSQAVVTIARAYGSERNMPLRYYNNLSGSSIGATINVKKLMLPGFGVTPLSDIVEGIFDDAENHADLISRIQDAIEGKYGVRPDTYEGLTEYVSFSEDEQDPYIIATKQYEEQGYKEFAFDFDGSDDREEIYPSIKWIGSNTILDAEEIEDDGTADASTDYVPEQQTFWIEVSLPFNPADHISMGEESFTVHFDTGMLGGRDFKCIDVESLGNNAYKLTLNREEDTSLDLWFPYCDFNAAEGDEFVLTDLDMPDEYVALTSLNELLPQAIEALLDNCDVRFKYSLDVDNIQMRRQHEAAASSDDSIYLTIAAGMEIYFGDDDLGINYDEEESEVIGSVLIDKLTIKEEDGKLPQFEIVLADEAEVGSLEAIQKQITTIVNGGGGMGNGAGIGYTMPQIVNAIRNVGGRYFLSKVAADTANGVIRFANGVNLLARTTDDVALNLNNSLVKGTSGGGIWQDSNGNWHAQFDYLRANKRLEATEVQIDEMSHVGGSMVLSATRCTLTRVGQADANGIVKCYFPASDDDGRRVTNDWKVGDQALVQTFNLIDDEDAAANRYWWRLVHSVGTEGDEHYIAFDTDDATKYDEGSVMPAIGDEVVLCGSRAVDNNNEELLNRQNVIILDSAGEGSPYVRIYNGVKTFNLGTPRIDLNAVDPKLNVSELTITASGGTKNVGEVIDESFLVWYVSSNAPTSGGQILSTLVANYVNFPAAVNGWTSADYAGHVKDIALTADGVCYRFEVSNGTYSWNRKADDFLVQALDLARASQQTLLNMASDSVITKQEKVQLKNWLSQIDAEKAQMVIEAGSIEIYVDEHTIEHVSTKNYVSAYNALRAFLAYFCTDMGYDTPLVNSSGYTLYARMHAGLNGEPNTYTLAYTDLSSQSVVAGLTYPQAVSRYYTEQAALRKNITYGVRQEFEAAAGSGIDVNVQAYISDLRSKLTIGDFDGSMSLQVLNEFYAALSSWTWTTEEDGEGGTIRVVEQGAGLITTSTFATMFSTAVVDDVTVASAILGTFCSQDPNTGVWYSTANIKATYFEVDTTNFKVNSDGDVWIKGEVTAKNFVNEFVTIPALYAEQSASSRVYSINVLKIFKGEYYYYDSLNSRYVKFEVGSSRNFIVEQDARITFEFPSDAELATYCPSGTRLLFYNASMDANNQYSWATTLIDFYRGDEDGGFYSDKPFRGVGLPDPTLGLTEPIHAESFLPVSTIQIGCGIIEFVSMPAQSGVEWCVTRISAAYSHLE